MIKKSLAFALAFVMLFPLTALASIDLSVFENKDIYKVDIDDTDGTGRITFEPSADGITNGFVGRGDDDSSINGTIIGAFDIWIGQRSLFASIRVGMFYCGDYPVYADDFIVKTSKHRYTFEVNSDIEENDGAVYEAFKIVIGDENKSFIEDLIEDGGTAQYCLSGAWEANGELFFNVDGLKTIYDDFTEAGGFEQGFTGLSLQYPCEIEDLVG